MVCSWVKHDGRGGKVHRKGKGKKKQCGYVREKNSPTPTGEKGKRVKLDGVEKKDCLGAREEKSSSDIRKERTLPVRASNTMRKERDVREREENSLGKKGELPL